MPKPPLPRNFISSYLPLQSVMPVDTFSAELSLSMCCVSSIVWSGLEIGLLSFYLFMYFIATSSSATRIITMAIRQIVIWLFVCGLPFLNMCTFLNILMTVFFSFSSFFISASSAWICSSECVVCCFAGSCGRASFAVPISISMQVWLSLENQFNYKAAYDLAVQTEGKNLPVVFKFGSIDSPTYYKFDTLEELTDFYTKAMKFINEQLTIGWTKKDSINWDDYKL